MKRNETERRLEEAAKADPKGAGAVYADWLEDAGRTYEAACWRQRAGLSELRFQVAQVGSAQVGSAQIQTAGRAFTTLSAARGWITTQGKWRRDVGSYEIRVFELRSQLVTTLPPKKES